MDLPKQSKNELENELFQSVFEKTPEYVGICRLIFIEENIDQWYACARKRGEIA